LIGAGKIGRGFLGHLAFRSGYSLTFVDTNQELVALMRARRAYRLHVLGVPAKDETVSSFQAWTPEAPEVEAEAIDADVVFVSVGGPNLPQAGKLMSRILSRRTRPLNVIVGENWPNAAAELRKAAGMATKTIGIAESTILRSCIEPTNEQRRADPLSIQVQDYWELPVDADSLVRPLPEITGLIPTPNFENALQRKVYTYNAINATIAYLGYHRGHKYLAEAANDPAVLVHALGVMWEVNQAICRTFGYSPHDQQAYADRALEKFQNPLIVDPIERQVRDPIRKLGPHDRLVGPAMLALNLGVAPHELALSIAAALQYRNPSDPAAVRLAQLVDELGPAGTLARIGDVDPASPLIVLVMQRYEEVGKLMGEVASR
jgi:mannitol-1-phosphate 5-dehydrogenase